MINCTRELRVGVNMVRDDGSFRKMYIQELYIDERCLHWSSGTRTMTESPYYLTNPEVTIGPLYGFEEVEGELAYLNDPLGNDYVPGRKWRLIGG